MATCRIAQRCGFSRGTSVANPPFMRALFVFLVVCGCGSPVATRSEEPLNGLKCMNCETACCSGRCVDTSLDKNNCGGCNVVCGAGQYCDESQCTCLYGQPWQGHCAILCHGILPDGSDDTAQLNEALANVAQLGGTVYCWRSSRNAVFWTGSRSSRRRSEETLTEKRGNLDRLELGIRRPQAWGAGVTSCRPPLHGGDSSRPRWR
jgi:hypothetical protein